MDQDDLENTMRHGLEELANDAPRGEGLWETTTSMIAIHVEADEHASAETPSPAETPPPPSSAPASSPDRRGLWIGIAIGAVIGILVAIIVVLLLTRDAGGSGATGTRPKSSLAPTVPSETANHFAPGPIPAADFVFNDVQKARIVVADATFNELGVLTPGRDASWQAVQLAPDRTRLYVTRADGDCGGLSVFDLRTRALTTLLDRADVVALSPEASKAVVSWDNECAATTGNDAGTTAVRDITSGAEIELPEVAGGDVSAAWSPDGHRVLVRRNGDHNAEEYDAAGAHLATLDRPHASPSQNSFVWNADGVVLFDVGNENDKDPNNPGTAVVRLYDPANSHPIREITRIDPIDIDGVLNTPVVRGAVVRGGRLYVMTSDANGKHATLWRITNGKAEVVVANWPQRRLVG
jgi:hypothetical protein